MSVKPAPWAVSQAHVDPEYQDLWRGLMIALPLWQGSSKPTPIYWNIGDLDPNFAEVGTPTWAIGEQGVGLDLDGSADALEFDGSPTLEKLPQTHNFTVCALFRPHVASSSDAGVSWSAPTNKDHEVVIYPNDNQSGSGGYRVFWRSAGTIIDENGPDLSNEWHQMTFVARSSTSRSIYRDGEHIATDTTSITTDGGVSNKVNIGSYRTNSQFLDGEVGYFFLWNRALSDAEVSLLGSDPFGLIRPASLIIPEVLLWPSIDDDPASPIDTDYINNAVAL